MQCKFCHWYNKLYKNVDRYKCQTHCQRRCNKKHNLYAQVQNYFIFLSNISINTSMLIHRINTSTEFASYFRNLIYQTKTDL